MPKRMVDIALKFLVTLKPYQDVEGWISFPAYIKQMRLHCGARSETIQRYKEFIDSLNIISEHDTESNRIKIRWDRIDQLSLEL